jgi:hypothetical protein
MRHFLYKYGQRMGDVYRAIFFAAGFTRGFQCMDYHDYKNNRQDPYADIMVNKVLRGCGIGLFYATIGGPLSMYQWLGRIEVSVYNKNPHDYSFFYSDAFLYTNLRPEIKSLKNDG